MNLHMRSCRRPGRPAHSTYHTAGGGFLLQDVQTRINDVAAFPITGLALNPDLVGISLVSTLRVSGSPTQIDQQMIVSAATNAAANYINNLRIDEALIINEIADRIRAADPRIIDVGDPNHPIPEIYIWRSRNDGTRWSRSLVANYTRRWRAECI